MKEHIYNKSKEIKDESGTAKKGQSSVSRKSRVKVKEPGMYNVIMLNDDFTPMDFVVDMLIKYFEKSTTEATNLMLSVHKGNRAIVGTYVYDVAITKTMKVTITDPAGKVAAKNITYSKAKKFVFKTAGEYKCDV